MATAYSTYEAHVETARQADGKFGSWKADESSAGLTAASDKPGSDLGLSAHPDAQKLLTVDAEHQDYNDEARLGVLSSECAAIMGDSPSLDSSHVWNRKQEGFEAVHRGKHLLNKQLEPYVRSRFEEQTGLQTQRAGLMAKKQVPYLRADVEGFTSDGGVLVAGTFESGDPEAKDWKADKAPATTWWKAQQDMAVTGRQHAYAVGLQRDNGEVHIVEVDRDEEAVEELEDAAADFWGTVEHGIRPAHSAEPEARKERLPRSTKTITGQQLEKVRQDVRRYRDHQRDEEVHAETKARSEATLRGYLGEHETLVDHEGKVLLSNKISKTGKPTLSGLTTYDERLAEKYAVDGAGAKRTSIDVDAVIENEGMEFFRSVASRQFTLPDEQISAPSGVSVVEGPEDIIDRGSTLGLSSAPEADQLLSYDVSEQAWLAERKNGIGGSEVAKALGESSYGGPASLYDEKTSDTQVFSGNRITEIGDVLEEPVRRRFEEITGIKTQRKGLLASKARPHQRASVDAFTADGGALEIKTFGPFTENGKHWSAGSMPRSAWLQLQQAMAVSGRGHGYGIGMNRETGQTYVVQVDRDEQTIGRINEAVDEVWDSIQRKQRPAAVAADSKDAVKRNLRASVGSVKKLNAEESATAHRALARRQAAIDVSKTVAAEKKPVVDAITETMGDADFLADDQGRIIAKNSVRRQISTTALKEKHPAKHQLYSVTSHNRGVDETRLAAEDPEAYQASLGRRATWG